MNELLTIGIYFLGILQGVAYSFMVWAPDNAFKRGFVNGITLKFLWKKQ